MDVPANSRKTTFSHTELIVSRGRMDEFIRNDGFEDGNRRDVLAGRKNDLSHTFKTKISGYGDGGVRGFPQMRRGPVVASPFPSPMPRTKRHLPLATKSELCSMAMELVETVSCPILCL